MSRYHRLDTQIFNENSTLSQANYLPWKNLTEKVFDSIEKNTPKCVRIPSIILQNLLPLITSEIEIIGYSNDVNMYYRHHKCRDKFCFKENFDWREYNKWFYSMEEIFVMHPKMILEIQGELRCIPGGAKTFKEILPGLAYTIGGRFIFITSLDYGIASGCINT